MPVYGQKHRRTDSLGISDISAVMTVELDWRLAPRQSRIALRRPISICRKAQARFVTRVEIGSPAETIARVARWGGAYRRGTDNRDYRWSSTPDADRCTVFGIRLGQRPSEPHRRRNRGAAPDRGDRTSPRWELARHPRRAFGVPFGRSIARVALMSHVFRRMPPLQHADRVFSAAFDPKGERVAQAACQGVDRHPSKPPTFTARWRRSANRVVKRPSPKGTATARLRRFRTFPLCYRTGRSGPKRTRRSVAARLPSLFRQMSDTVYARRVGQPVSRMQSDRQCAAACLLRMKTRDCAGGRRL